MSSNGYLSRRVVGIFRVKMVFLLVDAVNFLSCTEGWFLTARSWVGRLSYIGWRYFILSYIHSRKTTAAQYFNCTAKLWAIIIVPQKLCGKRLLLCTLSLLYLLFFSIFKKRYAAAKGRCQHEHCKDDFQNFFLKNLFYNSCLHLYSLKIIFAGFYCLYYTLHFSFFASI